jgi:hypothetical protein
MINRVTEIGRSHGMEHEKTKVVRISQQPCSTEIMTHQKQLQNTEYFDYLGGMIANDTRRTRENKSRIATAKAAFNKKKALFISKLDLHLRKKLVNCYIWSKACYGAETLTLGKADQKYLTVLKCGAGKGWSKSVGPNM